MAERLTPQRLFSDPPLTRGAPADLKFAPGGRFLTYRRAAADDRDRMDLWRIDINSGDHALFINAAELTATSADVAALTAEERAERERRRQFSHGINQYQWHPNGDRLVIPMDGQVFLVQVDNQPREVIPLCPPGTRQTGLQLSPQGHFVSYVRDGDLYVTSIAQHHEQRLTQDAGDLVRNGLPDFLAAEEMHRFEGHWWSPDEKLLAFTKVDESPVAVSYRLEMDANGARTIPQRYPYTGATNPDVSLWIYDFDTGSTKRIWRNDEHDAYLARVHMGATGVLIQTQDRLQQRLTLSVYDSDTATWLPIFEERSSTWVNLHDDFRELATGRYLVSSEQAGTRQLVLVGQQAQPRYLQGPTHVNKVLAHDDQTVWVGGWHTTPIENHLFAVDLNGSGYRQLTAQKGWHDTVVDVASGRYLDYHSNATTPPSLMLSELNSGSPASGQDTTIFREEFSNEHPYAPYLPLHAKASFGALTAEDGQTLYYRLTPPAEISGSHATVVYVYGGPGPQKAKNEWSPLLLQLFAHQGFAVLEIDNRGSGNRGRAFEAPIYHRMGSVEVRDQVAGLAALDEHSWADKARVGVFGHSYGGYMTLMCLSHASEHFRAGVAVAPVSDWAMYDTHYTERYMGLPDDNAEGYRQANVLTHLEKLRAPLLLMHGMADDNVLFTHSTMIMAKLQELGQPFELMTYPGAKHSMQERDVSIHRFNMILDFFKRHLGPGV